MAKNLTIAFFSITVIIAFFLYFNRKNTISVKQNFDQVKNSIEVPAIRITGMQLIKFRGNQTHTSVVSGEAKLKEPNQILLSGDLEALRIQPDRLEKVSSNSATVFFKAKNINELIHSAGLDRAEISGNVKIVVNETELQTEKADFLADKQTLVSKFPVLLTSPGKKVKGTDGFYLDLDRQEMELFGDIEGELQVDAKKH